MAIKPERAELRNLIKKLVPLLLFLRKLEVTCFFFSLLFFSFIFV